MRRGFLVPAMLVVSVFMVLCVGMLSRQPMRNLGAMQTHYQVQARQMALAGMEEIRVRLAGDRHQSTVANATMAREVPEAGSTEGIGSYVVTLDTTWNKQPYGVLRIESEGFYGPATRPKARYVLRATLDGRQELEEDKPNPAYLTLLRWQESVP
jgi:hypothetical protein